MNKKLKIVLIMILALGFGSVAWGLDMAMDANLCQQVKTRLKEIKVRDAVDRVNYGQNYESLKNNVMLPTNTRLVANQYKPVELLSITDEYEKTLNQFRHDYIIYEEKMSEVLELQCQQGSDSLMGRIEQLRQLRQPLNSQLKRLNQLAVNYQTKFKEFYHEAKPTNQ